MDGLGPFWTLSEKLTFQLRAEWRKGVSHVMTEGKNILEGAARCRGPEMGANLVS